MAFSLELLSEVAVKLLQAIHEPMLDSESDVMPMAPVGLYDSELEFIMLEGWIPSDYESEFKCDLESVLES